MGRFVMPTAGSQSIRHTAPKVASQLAHSYRPHFLLSILQPDFAASIRIAIPEWHRNPYFPSIKNLNLDSCGEADFHPLLINLSEQSIELRVPVYDSSKLESPTNK